MTAAYRFRGLGWFLSGVVVVLGFYLVSLQVAAERKKVDDVSRAIVAAKREIRALETEFNTRANLAQLERWNGEVLALTAPNADQFVADEAALARLDLDHGGTGPQVANVAYVVPTAPPVAAAPEVQPLPVPAQQVAVAAVVRAAPEARTELKRTTLPRTILASAAPLPASIAKNAVPTRGVRSTRAVAMLDRSLLSDATIGDLVDGARAEAGGLR